MLRYYCKTKRATAQNKQTPLSPNNEINKPTVGGYSDGKEKTMRYKNYILSKGDKVRLNPYGNYWLPSMTKNYGGKVVTIKDFMYNFGFECEPLGNDVAGYLFSYDDIDEVVYCKLREKGRRMNEYNVKKALKRCSAVGPKTGCSDCPYCYRCKDLNREALCIITEQEKEIDALKEKCELLREYEK